MITITLFFSILQELAREVKKHKARLVLRGNITLTYALKKAIGKSFRKEKNIGSGEFSDETNNNQESHP